jgi:hypothetical protein
MRLGAPSARTMWSFTFCWRVMAGLPRQPVGARCERSHWRSEKTFLEELLPVRPFVIEPTVCSAASTVSREVARQGGRPQYRANEADHQA